MRGVEAAPSVDLSDAAVVAEIQAWLPPDDSPVFSRARVLNQADGYLWYVPKSGSPYPALAVSATDFKAGFVNLVGGTAAVAFATNMPSGDYAISLTGGDEILTPSSVANTGFVVTSSDGTSTSKVRWTAQPYINP